MTSTREPRGLLAGYKWPQYSVHRGGLQMLLYKTAVERLGADAIRTGMEVTGYRNHDDRVRRHRADRDSRRRAPGDRRLPADRRGRTAFGRARTDASRPAADSVGRRHHVAWHHTGRADPNRRVVRRPRHPSPPGRLLPDLGTRHRHRPRDHQLDRGDHRRQLAAAGTIGDWNRKVDVESCHPSLSGLELRLAGRPGHAARCRRRCSSIR